MPDTLNKQSLINLLIDSPLREPIKINLIDIINNTSEPDLPKIYSTITKELEIFQKATERRMKLAEETIAKLGGITPTQNDTVSQPDSDTPPVIQSAAEGSIPPLDLPPLQQAPATKPVVDPAPPVMPPAPTPLSVPPLDLPPLPQAPAPQPVQPTTTSTSDEDALAQIQKELDSLRSETLPPAPTPSPAPAPSAPLQQ